MLKRLYVHNFRCLENFDLPIGDLHSALLIGKNGAGKTTIGNALEVLQKIARGKNRVGEIVRPKDFSRGQADVPMRFEVEVLLGKKLYQYMLTFELPENFKEMRVREESLTVDGKQIYKREQATVTLSRSGMNHESKFTIDWHLVALPIIQQSSKDDPITELKSWLERMLILRAIPSLMKGTSDDETLLPEKDISDYGAWFSGILASAPAAYSRVDTFLKTVMADLRDIQNPLVGPETRSISLRFSKENRTLPIPFDDLSDGEKCFMICALVLACHLVWDEVFCFWDEPDNYLSPDEVGYVAIELRKAFKNSGQLIVCSHSPQLIERFSSENTLVMDRRSHLDPSIVRPLSEIEVHGDFSTALMLGEVRV